MRTSALISVVLAIAVISTNAQGTTDPKVQGLLKMLFPGAAGFSPKGGDPPHYKVYGGGSGDQTTGLAFWTTELEPLERGYDGPIKILVGMDTKGILSGIVVVEHHEPYGNFSIDLPRFPAQFRGKSIRDPFKVGGDIDAVSRATMTITSASRAVRNSARRVARQFLAPPSGDNAARP